MNERIKELAEQAGFMVGYNADAQLERFAELVRQDEHEWVGLTELEVKHYNNRLSGSNVAQEIESKLRERNT